MTSTGQRSLLVAGGAALAGGALHVAALVGGPRWIAALGAPAAIVQLAREGSWLVPAGGIGITLLMWLCAAYAFSGAGRWTRLPLLRSGLAGIALVCTARAMLVVPLLAMRAHLPAHVVHFEIVAAFIWFAIGLAYLLGLASRWKELAVA